MIHFASLYSQSWTGRGRRAFTMEGGRVKLNLDFCRWMIRYFKRKGKMVLYQTIKSEHATILVFKNDDCEKSMVRYVAETILELGEDPEGVPTEALHYCVPGHPFSSMQRLRELCAAYRRQWPGFMETDPIVDSHKFKGNRYYFSKQFLAWLRASLPEIERVVYPVTMKKRFHDESLDNPLSTK